MKELLEKIPAEKRWEITAKFLWRFLISTGVTIVAPEMGKGEGWIAPVLGWEKVEEIATKIWAEGGRKFYPWVKETFNIPVEDAIGAAKLSIVAGRLVQGPEMEGEIVEATPERTVVRWTNCTSWERHKELELDPGLNPCPPSHEAGFEAGLKAINPKLTFKITKAMPWGDPYCEDVYEFKDE